MEKNILVINIGSSSKKYSLYKGETLLFGAHFESDKEKFEVTYDKEETQVIDEEIFIKSLQAFYKTLKIRNIIDENNIVEAIGIRLVAPGSYFTEDHIVDEDFLKKLKVVAKQDAIHIEPLQKELTVARKLFGKDKKVVAISDSAFHNTMDKRAKNYALPKDIIEKEDLKRFGYHGISLSNIVRTLSSRPWGIEKKVIICHLGSGSSVTAIYDGKSIDTSMGYSPLSGLPMSSRVGDIDVGAVLHLAENKSIKELEELFYTKSGFLAISDLSNDMRVLIDRDKDGHVGATNAIETFSYMIRKYIGMYVSVLGGVDAIVFSGTIGERSFIIRERICRELGWLNIRINNERNIHAKSGDKITEDGCLNVYVVNTDEDFEIAKKTAVLI